MTEPVKLYKTMHKTERTSGNLNYSCNAECAYACTKFSVPASGREPHSTMYDQV